MVWPAAAALAAALKNAFGVFTLPSLTRIVPGETL